MLLSWLLLSVVGVQGRRRESIWRLCGMVKSRVLLRHRWLRHLLWEAGCSRGTVIEEATLSGALVAEVAAGVCIAMLSAPALRRGMVTATDLTEWKRARVARAAQRGARHMPAGAACVQPWVVILLLSGHLIDECRLLLLWPEGTDGCWLG